MPTYEFYCEACNYVTEASARITSIPDFTSCQSCSKPAKRQVALNAAFHLGAGAWSHNRHTGESNIGKRIKLDD